MGEFNELSFDRLKYSELLKLFQHIFTLPCTQAKCERDFSIFKNIKTSNRSQFNDQNLESHMIIKTNCDLLPMSAIPIIIDRIAEISPQLKKLLVNQ